MVLHNIIKEDNIGTCPVTDDKIVQNIFNQETVVIIKKLLMKHNHSHNDIKMHNIKT